jgi:Tol biopolymer transport system component
VIQPSVAISGAIPRVIPVALITTGLVAFSLAAAGHAADLSFATPDGLFRIDPGSRDRTSLISGGDRSYSALAWSTDGQRLAVVQDYSDVYQMVPGSETSELLFSSRCQRPPTIDLAWQSNGETLVINERCSSPTAGAVDQQTLWLSSASGAATPLSILPDTLESEVFLAPDASRIAYVANQHIFIADLNGGRPRRITQTPGRYAAAGSPLAWSPDGSRLAFYEGDYPFQRLNVVAADGGDRRVLTPEANFQIYRSRVMWSPDGRYIAFYRPHNPPFSNQEIISLVNVNTGETQDLTRPGFYDALSWAPNSQQLVLASGAQAGQQTLFRLDLVNQEFTPLTPQPLQNLLDSQWAPDASWIAFTATLPDDDLGTQMLFRVRPDGAELAPLTGTDEYVYPFVWIPETLTTDTQGVGINL